MSRWKAAAIHLSISAAIGLISALMIFGVWYPPPYSHAAGADELVLLLLSVDIVLGPLMTLVVFKVGKKSLRFDLGVIAIVQTCAFIYGMSVVVRARPAFIVGEIDRFVLVSASDLDPKDLAQATQSEYRKIPWTGPRLVIAELPSNVEERNALVFSGTAGKDIEKFPKFYLEPDGHTATLLAHAKPIDELRRKQPDAAATVDKWLSNRGRSAADIVWVPLKAPRADLTMMLDRSTGAALGALPIYPW